MSKYGKRKEGSSGTQNSLMWFHCTMKATVSGAFAVAITAKGQG